MEIPVLFKRRLLFIILIAGLVPRILVAPYSSGSDIPQFAGFADTLHRHGLCFYMYADARLWYEEGWPYNWPYVYGPVWIYVLGFLRILASSPIEHYWEEQVYRVYVSMDWIVAVKTVLIAFDLVSALLLYKLITIVSGRNTLGYTALALFYLNPMTIYISSIYGMFDQVALAFILASVLAYREKPFLSGLLLGISVLTKQTMLYPALMLVLYTLLYRKSVVKKLVLGLASSTLLLAPFTIGCPSSIPFIIKSLAMPMEPGYTYPLVYSFNGISSLATYVHEVCGCDTEWAIDYWFIPSTILLLATAIYMTGSRDLVIPLSLSYIVFTATYWRVNHQYLVPAIAFLTILLAKTEKLSVKTLSLATILYIALWPVMFPTSWWLHAHIKHPNKTLWIIIDTLTLRIFCEPVYVVYAITLTQLQYLTITTQIWDKILAHAKILAKNL